MAAITAMLYRNARLIGELQMSDEEIDVQITAILCTMCLLCVEVGYDEVGTR